MPVRYSCVAQDHRRPVEVVDNHVEQTAIEKIANRQTSPNTLLLQRGSGLGARVTERAIALIHLQDHWLAISTLTGKNVHLRINMTGDCHQIEPAIIVEISE